MFEKYMILNNKIICGQNNSGLWYCKELPVDNVHELDALISKINGILNKYNVGAEEKNSVTDTKIKHKT